MDERVPRIRRWFLALAMGYAVLWVVYWGSILTLGDGLESGQGVTMTLSSSG